MIIKVDQGKAQAQKRAEQEAKRQRAYTSEADPIGMRMLRDEATKDEWLAKIEEIKTRFPYPAEQP